MASPDTDTISEIIITVNGVGTEYNFGERGLKPEYLSKRLALSSTPASGTAALQQLINDAPVVRLNGNTGANFAATFTPGGTAVPIVNTTAATLSQADGGWLNSLTARIENPTDGAAEVLTVANATLTETPQALPAFPKIRASYAGGVLTLSGPDELSRFQSVLRTLTYRTPPRRPIRRPARSLSSPPTRYWEASRSLRPSTSARSLPRRRLPRIPLCANRAPRG